MTNVTISIDENELKQARLIALQQGTSLNAVLRSFLTSYIGSSKRYKQLTSEVLNRIETSSFQSSDNKTTRDSLYER